MALTFKVILSDRPKKDGTYPVLLRITLDRQTLKPSLSIYVLKKHFNPKGNYDQGNWIRNTHLDFDLYNRQIQAIIRQVRTHVTKTLEQGEKLNLAAIKAIVSQKEFSEQNLTDYFNQWANQFKNVKPSTFEIYTQTIKRLTEFNLNKPVYFNQINKKFLEGFEKWVMTEYISKSNNKTPGQATVSLYLSKIKAVLKQAVRDNVIKHENNPFLHLKIKKAKPKPKAILTLEELELLKNAELPFDSEEWHARNIFLCQYYTLGTRIIDMLLLEFSFINKERVEYKVRKTNKDHSVKLHEDLMSILNQYAYRSKHRFVFPYMEEDLNVNNKTLVLQYERKHTRVISRKLTTVASRLGINKKISTHVSRHSFTAIALTGEGSIFGVSEALGNSDTKTIEAYSRQVVHKVIDDLTDKVYGKNKNVVELLPTDKKQ